MTTITAHASTAAAALQRGDRFAYANEEATVVKVTPLSPTYLEVEVILPLAGCKWLDYADTEAVKVIGGPTFEAAKARAEAVSSRPAPTPTALALAHVQTKATSTLPASATLVLYALAAAQSDAQGPASLAQVAAAAGLAQGTVTGHLRSLEARGAASRDSIGRWQVRTPR